jgi:hypothetical protein
LPKPLKEYVQQVLAEHGRGEKIRLSLEHGFAAGKAHPKSQFWRRKSTNRAIVWESAVERLIALTEGDSGVVVIPHHDTVSFLFDRDVLIRLKKADLALRSSNYPTPQADLFHTHEADLFGFVGVQRVEAVYIPNRFETALVWTGVVARQSKSVLWHHELTTSAPATVVQLPFASGTTTADLAKLKDQPEKGVKGEEK